MKKLLLGIFLLLNFLSVYSQEDTAIFILQGRVKSLKNLQNLPFAKISINYGERVFLSSINGEFLIKTTKSNLKSISIKVPYFREFNFKLDTNHFKKSTLTQDFYLTPNQFQLEPTSTDSESKTIIEECINQLSHYNPYLNNSFSTNIYHKFLIDSDETEEYKPFTSFLSKRILGKNTDELPPHHVFLMETFSTLNFLNTYQKKEIIQSYKVSGVQDPSILSLTSQLDFSTIYDSYITIAHNLYINPLLSGTFKRYNFEVIDSISVANNKKIYIINFGQKPTKNFNGLKGLIYIQYPEKQIINVIFSPHYKSNLGKVFIQKYEIGLNNKSYPTQSFIDMNIKKTGLKGVTVSIQSKTIIDPAKPLEPDSNYKFNSNAVEFYVGNSIKNEDFINNRRKLLFNSKDSNTYIIYKNLERLKYIDKFINFGQNVYYGDIALNKFNIEVNKSLNFNDYERFRTGLGINTNEYFSKNWKHSIYTCYGIGDQKFKYGFETKYFIDKHKNHNITYLFRNDLSDAGASKFSFNQYMYSSERLRKYRILMKDKEIRNELKVELKPHRYTQLKFGVNQYISTPTYQYKFSPLPEKINFKYLETSIGLRYSFREFWGRSEYNKIPIKTKYPIVFAQLTKGWKSNISDFDYTKAELRIDFTKSFLNFGFSTFQFKAGIASSYLPYQNLFNLYGTDNKKVTVVIHNSFITMNYNEFVANQYAALFYVHNFGRFYANDRFFNPVIEFMFNAGIGKLNHPEYHEYVKNQSINKGFYESGFNLNNILNLDLSGMHIGLGLGIFYRFGPYAYDSFKNNLVTKLGTNFYF